MERELDSKLQLISTNFSSQKVAAVHALSPVSQQATVHIFLEQLAHSWQEPGQAKSTLSSKHRKSTLCLLTLLLITEVQVRRQQPLLLNLHLLLQALLHPEVTSRGFKEPAFSPTFYFPFPLLEAIYYRERLSNYEQEGRFSEK